MPLTLEKLFFRAVLAAFALLLAAQALAATPSNTPSPTWTVTPSATRTTTLGPGSPTWTRTPVLATNTFTRTASPTSTPTYAGPDPACTLIMGNIASQSPGTAVFSLPQTITAGTNRLLLLAFATSSSTDYILGADFGGLPLSQIRQFSYLSQNLEIWYLENPPVGSGLINVTRLGTAACEAVSVAIQGSYPGAPFGGYSTGGVASGTHLPLNFFSSSANHLVFGLAANPTTFLYDATPGKSQIFAGGVPGISVNVDYSSSVQPAGLDVFDYDLSVSSLLSGIALELRPGPCAGSTPTMTFTPTATLVFSPEPAPACLASGDAAIGVVGQPDLASASGGTSVSQIAYPRAVAIGVNKLYVVDQGNNRVMGWNSVGGSFYGAPADFQLGQPNWTSGTQNQGGSVGQGTLSVPWDISSDGNRLYLADYNNFRVLIWNSLPSAGGTLPDLVVGQADFNSAINATSGAASLGSPRGVYSDGQRLFVSDSSNSRVLIWNSLPAVNGQAASLVLGQSDFSGSSPNHCACGSTDAKGLNTPGGLSFDGARLYVADTQNHRVLVWYGLPTGSFQPANLVLGQSSFLTSTQGSGASGMYLPTRVFSDGTRVFVSDTSNNRVLVWDTPPTSNGQPADRVLGQADFSGLLANQGATSGPSTLSGPNGITTGYGKLWVTDYGNSRILAYACTAMPTPSATPTRTLTATRTVTPVLTPSPTRTVSASPTITATPAPGIMAGPVVDDFEDGNFFSFNGGSDLGSIDPYGSFITLSKVTGCPFGSPGIAMRMSGTIMRDGPPNYPYCQGRFGLAPGNAAVDFRPVAAAQALTFNYRAGSAGVNYLVSLASAAITDYSFYRYAFTSVDTNWHTITIYFPGNSLGATPQFAQPAWGTPVPWASVASSCSAIVFDVVPAPAVSTSFDLTVDDISFAAPEIKRQADQVATAMGVSVQDVMDTRAQRLDEQTEWLVLRLMVHCGCHPQDVLALRATMSWGEIAEYFGISWSALLAEVQSRASAAGMRPLPGMPDEIERSLVGNPLGYPIPTPRPYLQPTFSPGAPYGGCPW